MAVRHWWKAFGIVCGFVFLAAAAEAWTPVGGLTYLTFNRPVSLPGVTLGTGTYAFEIANPMGGSDVVMVRDRERKHVYFSGLTNGIDRLQATNRDGAVMFGEAGPHDPVPIVAWFPSNASHGRQFIYRR
ncbi:MAG TPA: hypothetical protein VFB07_10490 [Vicinamibacterales bacterium]|nr:hypothetical protein [Vicinamibacterales bacterium]